MAQHGLGGSGSAIWSAPRSWGRNVPELMPESYLGAEGKEGCAHERAQQQGNLWAQET